MKVMTNNMVVDQWRANTEAKNHRGSLTSTGAKLYSYNLCIGDTSPDGTKFLKDYSARGTYGFQSQTTSCHVGIARGVADVVL